MSLKSLLTGTKEIKLKNPFFNDEKNKSLAVNKSVNDNTSFSANTTTFIAAETPIWRNLSELKYLLECYCENPVVQAVVNIKAEAMANIRFKVKDLKTGEITLLKEYEEDKGRLRNLIAQPNPLQSTMEWIKQLKVNYEVFGNSYCYASLPVGYENNFTYEDINVINNLPPYCVKPVLTGNWLDATSKGEIIKHYKFTGLGLSSRTFETNTVFHTNNVNIKLDKNFTEGKSDLIALKWPISNIDAAYESKNVMIKKRGALGVFTSEKKDDVMGSLPLKEDEIELVQKEFQKYGIMDDQYSHIISPFPLKYQKTAMSVKDLMLFEEIESSAIAVAVAKGVPELLVKYYIKGGTFNNLEASEKRLYDSTIIPETEHFMVGLNSFLKTKGLGIELIGSYDHLNILQKDKKDEAETDKIKVEAAKVKFSSGLITFGQYAIACDVELSDKTLENTRVWDLSPKQLNALGINVNKNNNEE